LLRHFAANGHCEVILQIFPDAGQIKLDLNAVLPQFLGMTDARQHQQMWRVERPAAQDNFAGGPGVFQDTSTKVLKADGAIVLNDDLHRCGVGLNGEVRASLCRLQKSARSAASLTVSDGGLVETATMLACTIEVWIQWHALVLGRIDEPLSPRVWRCVAADCQWSTCSMVEIIELAVVL
jgi:hypothetical protein